MSVANGAFGKSAQGAFIQSVEGSARAAGVAEKCYQGDTFLAAPAWSTYPFCDPTVPPDTQPFSVTSIQRIPPSEGLAEEGSTLTSASTGQSVTVGSMICSGPSDTNPSVALEVWNVTFAGGVPAAYDNKMILARTIGDPLSIVRSFYQQAVGPPYLWLFDDGSGQRIYSSACDALLLSAQVFTNGLTLPADCAGPALTNTAVLSSGTGINDPNWPIGEGARVYDSATTAPVSTGAWFELGPLICSEPDTIDPARTYFIYGMSDASFNFAGSRCKVLVDPNNPTSTLVTWAQANAGGNQFSGPHPAGGPIAQTILPPI